MAIRTLVALILLGLLGYGAIEAWPLLSGPDLRIDTPATYSSGTDGFVSVSGIAKHTGTLALNGGTLLIDEQGRFSTTLLLPQGNAILTLTATDRFGRSVTERRTVFIP